MLARLVIQDVVLIGKLALDLSEGLSVFTGETGAGKSILLDALGLALGARSDAALVRKGATQAVVSADFTGPFPGALKTLLAEQGLDSADGTLILRRVVAADGKSRAYLNDQPIGIALLRSVGDFLVDVHGQYETYGLLNPATHRDLLDAFGKLLPQKFALRLAYDAWRAAEKALSEAATNQQRARAEEDYLRAAVGELDDLAPREGEADALAAQRTRLQNRDKILEALEAAQRALEDERGAIPALAQAGKFIVRLTDKAPDLAAVLAQIDRAANDAAEAAQAIEHFAASFDDNPTDLDAIEARLFALRGAARKHGVAPEDLGAVRDDLRAKLSLLEGGQSALRDLSAAAATAQKTYQERAQALSKARQKAARDLEKAVQAELPPLKLERAQFHVRLEPLPPEAFGPEGIDRIAFEAATNPGAAPGALQKVASGGELARFMLAIKVVLARPQTLVFDEVDTGIGGQAASAVGDRLAQLGQNLQVLVITHSPQVAARGAHAFRVVKRATPGGASTDVEPLAPAARVEEIARMLAGSETTKAARQAAQSLLDDAAAHDAPPKKKRKA